MASLKVAQQFDIRPNAIAQWRSQRLRFRGEIRGGGNRDNVKVLNATVGESGAGGRILPDSLSEAELVSAKRPLSIAESFMHLTQRPLE